MCHSLLAHFHLCSIFLPTMGSVRAVALSASAQGHVGIGMLHDSSSGGASSSSNAARAVVAGTAVAQQVAVFADERMIRDRVPVTAALDKLLQVSYCYTFCRVHCMHIRTSISLYYS
jgi:hypothetical protein